MLNYQRYQRVPVMQYPEREWPNREIVKAPVWCSVDLRDGNQALIDPMVVDEKLEMYELLLRLGFREIEVGFPAASQIEFDFIRRLIEEDRIPDGVRLQVLSQCRKEQIDRTFECIRGCRNVIFHIYNSTSTLQRDVVFGMSRDEVRELALQGVRWVREGMRDFGGNLMLEYSPESYTGTEPDYALEVCNAVIGEWKPTPEQPMIINLPSTVEMTTPNVFADGVEWMSRRLDRRDSVILSIHPHNDRGTGTATAELALLAGADRLEGTLFGNGERTGNLDILNVAYNMFSQGIDPKLNIENIGEIIAVCERCNKMPIDPRHPYGGKLVFTSFSGSHQDAINKGMQALRERNSKYWAVPYLTIDPADIGRRYEPIVRINSQSGKGGVAFVMDSYFGFKLPKGMHREFADVIQKISEREGEVAPEEIMAAFRESYLDCKEPLHFRRIQVTDLSNETESSFDTKVSVVYTEYGREKSFEAVGNGPLDAVGRGVRESLGREYRILDYTEHALTAGSDSQAAAYIHLMDADSGRVTWGVGVSSNITRASVRGIFSAMNRLHEGASQNGIGV
ncbi:2-isopropylmalate synthase [Lachnoclostridium sp. Marseille-P6806]|uniref:2-isopropylmalate synthase n=1 Tax=Lachnoclostridium sp. Marseille-P6806 TaxID=2364793 RepID=UPI0010308A33|nr:2-isopropylmalate synthase [Lachnoclostridium sp. Marseille-P6806]